MQAWANGLIKAERTARTVATIWVSAARTVFGWAVGEKLVTRNPFAGWRVKVPKRIRTRETKSFTEDGIQMILGAALAVKVHRKLMRRIVGVRGLLPTAALVWVRSRSCGAPTLRNVMAFMP